MKPFQERTIYDYFIGVFPREKLDAMKADAVKEAKFLQGDGHDVTWETVFEWKIKGMQIKLLEEQAELMEKALEVSDGIG